MAAYALDILYTGFTIAVLGWIWLIVQAFRERIWWGIGSLLIPPLALVYAIRHAASAIRPLSMVAFANLVCLIPLCGSVLVPFNLGEQVHSGSRVFSIVGRALESEGAHEWMDTRAFYLQSGGVALTFIGWIWLIVRAFRHNRGWGTGIFAVPPVAFIFTAYHPRKGLVPLAVCLSSLLIAITPALYTLYVPVDLGEREKLVLGQRHLTLTGWDRRDYGLLRLKHDTVVLQMANADVTDETINLLRDMTVLEELDLNGTQVTDAGLAVLKDLPVLSRLRLARTKITNKGFADNLLAKDSLLSLDLSGTDVERQIIEQWRTAKPGRRALR
jgi:hypothetical protein